MFDLEDSVELTQKAGARNEVAAAIKELCTGTFGRFVRLNRCPQLAFDGQILERRKSNVPPPDIGEQL